MRSKPEHPVQATGFWVFGLLSVVLAVLKLTVAGYWSWWRVMLPLLAFLGHNAVYVLAGFLCFCWLKHDEEGESTTADKHSRDSYILAVLLFFFLFLDNLLRHLEGQGWEGVLAVLGKNRGGGPVWDAESVGTVRVLGTHCQRPQSRVCLKPKTVTVGF
jgi:hypothetical protein